MAAGDPQPIIVHRTLQVFQRLEITLPCRDLHEAQDRYLRGEFAVIHQDPARVVDGPHYYGLPVADEMTPENDYQGAFDLR